MDEVKIISAFTRTIISKLLRTIIRKKIGYDVEIQLNEANVTINNGRTHLHLDVDAELSKDELTKILQNIGLN